MQTALSPSFSHTFQRPGNHLRHFCCERRSRRNKERTNRAGTCCSLVYIGRNHRHRQSHARTTDDGNRPAPPAPARTGGGRRRLPEEPARLLPRAQGRHQRRSHAARHGRHAPERTHGRRQHVRRLPRAHGSDDDLRFSRNVQPHHRAQGAAKRARRREHRRHRPL